MDKHEARSNPDYEIGYGKPPKRGQFKAGQSGNPKGRKKGAKTIRGVMKAALNEKITVNIGGKVKKITKLEAMVQKTLASSLSGDVASMRLFVQMIQVAGLHNEVEDALSADHMNALSVQDQAMLERHLKTTLAEQSVEERAGHLNTTDTSGNTASND